MTLDAGPSSDPLTALRAALGAQYRIERLLGQGGMGSVYLARDLTLDRPVAIKVINPERSGDAGMRSRFLREARAVARLRHPNIVSIFAAGETAGMLYFVMEYVPGQSLRDLLDREGRLPADRAAQILRELALALHHAHAQGLVHRDVKPENVLLDAESGRALLTDFGIVRATKREGEPTRSEITVVDMILGSPRYMSPEQAAGDTAIDGRSDLYALALVGYEICSGTPVVQETSVAAMLVKHLTETPPPLATRVADLPPHLALAIDRGLTKAPADRWQTGRAFAEAIVGGSLTPSGEIAGASTGRHTQRRWVPAGLATAVAAACIVWFALDRRTGDGSGFLIAPFEIQSGDQEVAWLREGSVNMLTMVLGQWSDLRVVDYERTLSLLDAEGLGSKSRLSLDDALALARRAAAATVVTGQIQTAGDSLIVIARLFDARTGRSARQTQVVAVRGTDPRPLFDQLAQQLFDIQGGPASTMQLAQATTTSLEAYRVYLNGVRHLNALRVPEAGAEFDRAIGLDSSFALAYHKLAIVQEWLDPGSSISSGTAERAFALSGRLPRRERALAEGHHQLRLARHATSRVPRDTAAMRQLHHAALRTFGSLTAGGDSLVAEAWFGLAMAYYWGRTIPRLPRDSIQLFATRSLRALHRTLALDSTFHQAYPPLVVLYRSGNPVIDADSAILIDEEVVARLGETTLVRYRATASARGVAIARTWADANSTSAEPILHLVDIYQSADMWDSALVVLAQTARRPTLATPTVYASLLTAQMTLGDTGTGATLRYLLDRYSPDSLRTIADGRRYGLHWRMPTAAAMLGRSADLDRALALTAATDSVSTSPYVPFPSTLALYEQALRAAMGDSLDPSTRRTMVRDLRRFDGSPRGVISWLSNLPYLGYLTTRDTAFKAILDDWHASAPFTELAALEAISAGDTATALRVARTFPSPDSLRSPDLRFGIGGMRSVARAEVLAAVGMVRQAAEMLDATDLKRISRPVLAEPGYAIWVRSWLARARLWNQLGETARAIAAYEEFIRRWAEADGVAAIEVREARLELARLRDRGR